MEPEATSSGYYVNGFPPLRAVPSDYAFNREPSPQRTPTQTVSEYQLPGLNSWRTATQNPAYHYVQAHELPRIPESEQVAKGNIISLKALRERLTHLDDGFYQPTIVNGYLYIVPSGGTTHTARESHSDTKTAREADEPCFTGREVDSDLHTARLPQSPNVTSSIRDVRLTLNQLRRLLGRDLYREVLRKYKKETKSARTVSSGTDIHEEEDEPTLRTARDDPFGAPLRSARSSSSFHDQPESNCATAVEPGQSQTLLTARGSSSFHDHPESNVNTACEPATSEMERSSQDVKTALEIDDAVRAIALVEESFGFLPPDTQRSVTEMDSHRLTHTPQDFDNRAGASAQSLGAAPPPSHLASVEGEVKTATENRSETHVVGDCSSTSSTMAI